MNIDNLITTFDNAVRTLHNVYGNRRPYPAADKEIVELSDDERKHVAGLMRVDHVGEICAQALYQGQAFTAHDAATREHMLEAADEETDHLDWCKRRLDELDSHTSLLNPIWYAGSFAIGAAAGIAGNGWNLGFVVETERQVEAHLDDHLEQLPEQDKRSQAILQKMKEDEIRHADNALHAGGKPLPEPIKQGMRLMSRIMTTTAYKI
ncbi:MAG: 2-polyprenyl-3-methyl-6-methoxy-1,4-benzoquinone monooxygenase [Gammaproteobacteria bacterium]|nr:2-polyprenyl-3-methyl-6-methoxy-1,4-benzoquinone monooxygenase [Gammaproteobacteria bacterium]